MARLQLQHGKDPELRALAEKIIADQKRESAEMQNWLESRNESPARFPFSPACVILRARAIPPLAREAVYAAHH